LKNRRWPCAQRSSCFNSADAEEAIMAKDKKPSDNLSAMAGQTMEQARGAMENYLNFFQKSMSASPWAGAELNKKWQITLSKMSLLLLGLHKS
jgi:hypothetical protein